MAQDELSLAWLCSGDLDAVVDIERRCFASGWSKKDFAWHARQQPCSIHVASRAARVVGVLCYWKYATSVQLRAIAVHPEDQRTGIGGFMLKRLIAQVNPAKRPKVVAEVGEYNLPAQLFLKKHGFSWRETLTGYCTRPVECDAYRMILDLPVPTAICAS